jgi:predicted RNA-binding protein with PUA-like domain
VDVRALQRFTRPVTRDRLRAEKALAKMGVLQRGNRLSVQPVTPEEFERICEMGEPEDV